MKRVVAAIFLITLLGGCGKQSPTEMAAASVASAPHMAKMAADMSGGAEQALTELSEPAAPASSSDVRKYIAMRHNLTVETAARDMQASFDAPIAHCEALNCQVLTANFNKETPYNPPSASLSVRVPPRHVAVFLDGLAKSGEVIQHGRDAEDKTNQVVDADARIKNLTELRDRLRAMLANKDAKFKDVIEIERELANTQAQLDSIQSMRKVLALETDYVAVDINFSAAQGITEQGFFAPVAMALKNAGRVLMESVAAVITFVMSAIPWLLVGVPVVLLVRRYWVKIKAKWL